jgi:hypothetical protein
VHSVERLEGRIVLAAGIGYDRRTGVVAIVGSEGAEAVEVRQQGPSIVVSMNSAAGRFSRTLRGSSVTRVSFTGLTGDDSFTNRTAIPSRADGGDGNDALRGGRGADELIGGRGGDQLFGGDGTDRMQGGAGDDVLQGGVGADVLAGAEGGDDLFGGAGNDRLDGGDGDGYDNDYDRADILFDVPGNPPAYADDAAVTGIIATVTAELRSVLQIPETDAGLRVRVQINDGTAAEPGRFGDLVTGVWRYLTPDKIQVWATWCYPSSDPGQLRTFGQYEYRGPYSGNPADCTDPANDALSTESRLYAGYLMRPGQESPARQAAFPALVFVSWTPGESAGFFYSVPDEQATGFAPPIAELRAALAGLPNFTTNGDSFSDNLATTSGLPGVQPVLGLLRTISRTNSTWYASLRSQRSSSDALANQMG